MSNFEPSPKSPGIDLLIESVFGKNRADTIRSGKCTTCNTPNIEFRNDISRKEYTISGMCQDCQDSVFGKN